MAESSARQAAELAWDLIVAYAAQMKDALNLYRPLPGNADAFHGSYSRTRLVCGSNRAGKTLTVAVEVARIARGMDPFKKRPDKDQIILAVGKDEEHIADSMFVKFWWPGAFQVVPDENTGLWRAIRLDPNNPRQIDPIDEARRPEWRPASPLLDPAKTKIVWQKKGRGVPKLCKFPNGSRIQWHTSKGAPRQGNAVDVGWLDEEIENKKWVPETQARLVDRSGALLASFTPQASTPQYFDLHKRAMNGEPNVESFHLHIEDNPYLPPDAKQELYNDLKNDPDELAVRWDGVFAISQRRIYPTYERDRHTVPGVEIPKDWTRILFVDPGTQFSGCLFGAVGPDENELHIYSELFLRNSDAQKFAAAVAPRIEPYEFETFGIDKKGGMQKPMGFSHTVEEHYAEEFGKLGLMSHRTQNRFEFGSDHVDGREYSVKRMLNADPPILRIHFPACSVLDRQLQNRYYDKHHPDKREERTQHELVDCLEYLCAWFDRYKDDPEHPFGLFYREPMQPPEETSDMKVYQYFLRKKRERERPRRFVISLGSRPQAISSGGS